MAMKIGLETPEEEYKNLMAEKVTTEMVDSDDEIQENFEKISAAARETVWNLLFAKQPTSTKAEDKAVKLLTELKRDSCFYSPWEYNKWIVEVRDKLLKNNMFHFWREAIVKHEFGPCWARDSDFFDDMEDPGPAAFYSYAGCVAPFSKDNSTTVTSTVNEIRAISPTKLVTAANVASSNTSLAAPALPYREKLQHQLDMDPDDKEKLSEIFSEARRVIWELLFGAESLAEDNFQKAADLLVAYKRDACFYSPYDYNDWIIKVRGELFTRKNYDFWQKVIVEKECGLCWYKDCDFFDDKKDTRPIDFYKSGNTAPKSPTNEKD